MTNKSFKRLRASLGLLALISLPLISGCAMPSYEQREAEYYNHPAYDRHGNILPFKIYEARTLAGMPHF